MSQPRNLFEIPLNIDSEVFEVIAEGDALIERIVSAGQITPDNQWYDQQSDEWVILLQGEARIFFEQTGEITLQKGDYILIKAHEKHRVTYTSYDPPCIWLAIHAKLTLKV